MKKNNSEQIDYKKDRSSITGIEPIEVIYALSHNKCKSVIKKANKLKIPIVIRGAGTGTTAGAVPIKKSILLSLEKMNKIIEMDEKNSTITVEPGVKIPEINKVAQIHNLFYPVDPASINICTIGGTVAENAGGPRALKYGVTKDYVIGLKGIWANGDTFELGGKQLKNVAGYNLLALLVGSEGTLGIITQITLKLIPKPMIIKESLCGFTNPNSAAKALLAVRQSGIQPSTAEFMLDICVQASLNYMNIKQQFKTAKAYIIWQIDGQHNTQLKSQMDQIRLICNENNGNEWLDMDCDKTSDYIWSIRRNISLALKEMAGEKESEDIVVPPAYVPKCLKALENIKHKSGIKVIGYGHLGDGNIHVNILKMNASNENWKASREEIIEKVMNIAISMGGTISGEHGIGITKKKYMPLVFTKTDIEIMKSIKQSIDPNNILNPGKIIDT